MSDFKDFYKNIKSKNLPIIQKAKTELALHISKIKLSPSIFDNSKQQEEKFEKQVIELAHSDNFLEEFSQKLEKPSEGETEDQFVERAKQTMTNLLKQKFK